jgi:hypothetical protein
MKVSIMIELPKFASESQEADWWFDHRDEISDEFVRAAAEGTLGEGSMARLARIRKKRSESEAAKAPELSGLRAK